MIPVSRPSIGQEELDAVAGVFKTGWLGLGATTAAFEEALQKRLGGRHVVAVNSGTSALHLALAGLGIGPGNEVIVPSLTFAGSIQAILAVGATPVFCESDEETLLMDLKDLQQRITPATRAVMPVHYGGQPCDMDLLLDLASRHGLRVIEDAAHAFGSTYKGRLIGSFGHATCFSFDPIKQITCGEGGAVVLEDDRIAERIRRMRLLGIDRDAWRRSGKARSWYYEVTTFGLRYHMPNFCAAIGLAQLEKLDQFIQRRRSICRRYDEAFRQLEFIRPLAVACEETAPFLYIVKVPVDLRDGFVEFLKARGIGAGVHYIANHIQPLFKRYAGTPLPRADRLWREIVSLPLYVDMTDAEVQTVMEAVVAFNGEASDLTLHRQVSLGASG
jgi:perosamine synthetase